MSEHGGMLHVVVVDDRAENVAQFVADHSLYFRVHPIHVEGPEGVSSFRARLRAVREDIGRIPDCVLMDINWYTKVDEPEVVERLGAMVAELAPPADGTDDSMRGLCSLTASHQRCRA